MFLVEQLWRQLVASVVACRQLFFFWQTWVAGLKKDPNALPSQPMEVIHKELVSSKLNCKCGERATIHTPNKQQLLFVICILNLHLPLLPHGRVIQHGRIQNVRVMSKPNLAASRAATPERRRWHKQQQQSLGESNLLYFCFAHLSSISPLSGAGGANSHRTR